MSFIDRFLEWGHSCLLESEKAQAYLLGRGISLSQFKYHQLGYTGGDFEIDPKEDTGHSDICSEPEKTYAWCDSCRYIKWSSFWEEPEPGAPKQKIVGRRISDCIIFPLSSYSGSFVGFQVRSISQKSYDTFALKRRPEGYFFGLRPSTLELIWSKKEVWLVEGAPDHLIIERLVVPNVLALTTNGVNKLQARFLYRFVDTVNLCLDRDGPGREGVQKFISEHGGHFRVRDIKYPHVYKDPGKHWEKVGDRPFQRYYQENVLSLF